MSKSLLLLVEEMSCLTSKLVELGGELSPELEAILDQVQGQLETKTDSYAFFIEKLDLEAKFWKEKAEKYAAVSKSCSNLKERLNGSIKAAMIALGKDEIGGEEMRFKLSDSTPRLVIDEALLLGEYKTVLISETPNKEKIRELLKEGKEVTGAYLETGKTLRKYVNRGKK